MMLTALSESSANAPFSLRESFLKAQKTYLDFELDNGELDQKRVTESTEELDRCLAHIHRIGGLYSDNEAVADIPTADLKYILAPAYRALLGLQSRADASTSSPQKARLEQLKRAKQYIITFLTSLDAVELLPDGRAFDVFRSTDRDDVDTLAERLQSLNSRTQTQSDAAQERMEKIAKYKQQKAAREKLTHLLKQASQMEETRKDSKQEAGNVDEETEREIVLATVEVLAHKCMDELRDIESETQLLEQFVRRQEDTFIALHGLTEEERKKMEETRRKQEGEKAIKEEQSRREWVLDLPQGEDTGPIGKDGKVRRPFVLVSKRSQLLEGVFKPHWRLPTMTIDEYLSREMDRGNIISGGGKEPEKKEIEDTDEAWDKETMRLRKWDEFTDEHRRGSGNRMNRS